MWYVDPVCWRLWEMRARSYRRPQALPLEFHYQIHKQRPRDGIRLATNACYQIYWLTRGSWLVPPRSPIRAPGGHRTQRRAHYRRNSQTRSWSWPRIQSSHYWGNHRTFQISSRQSGSSQWARGRSNILLHMRSDMRIVCRDGGQNIHIQLKQTQSCKSVDLSAKEWYDL